jgi:hypothetical protein
VWFYQQRNRTDFGNQRENGGVSPRQSHAQTRTALNCGVGALRDQSGNCHALGSSFVSCFLLAARKPSSHRSLIVFAACQCLVHAAVMTIQTVQAWKHGVYRNFMQCLLRGTHRPARTVVTARRSRETISRSDVPRETVSLPASVNC